MKFELEYRQVENKTEGKFLQEISIVRIKKNKLKTLKFKKLN